MGWYFIPKLWERRAGSCAFTNLYSRNIAFKIVFDRVIGSIFCDILEKRLVQKINKKNTSSKSPIYLETDDLEYEEMIENILINSGGQAFQSDIVTMSRLSKSKISVTTSEMKNKGKIVKIKKGKENLIRLVNK